MATRRRKGKPKGKKPKDIVASWLSRGKKPEVVGRIGNVEGGDSNGERVALPPKVESKKMVWGGLDHWGVWERGGEGMKWKNPWGGGVSQDGWQGKKKIARGG